MTRRNLLIALPVVLTLLMVGCAGVVPTGTLDRITKIAEGSAFAGVTGDLIANKQHRPEIEGSLKALDAVIASGKITGTQLSSIAATLPIKSETLMWVGGALVIYDAFSVLWWTPSSDSVSMAIAKGISNGAHLALAQSPAVLAQKSKTKSFAPRIPAPTADNVRKLR